MAGLAVLAGTGVLGGMQLSSTERLVPQAPVAVAAASAAPATSAPRVTTTTVAPAPPTTAAPEDVEVVAAAAPTPSPAPEPAPIPAPAPAPPPAPSPAPAPAPAPAPSTPAEMGAAALQLIDYPWQKLGYEVIFEGPNPGLLGKANCRTNQIWVYVRPTQTIRQVAFVTAFELGHAVDCGTMDSTRRAEWAAIRGFAPGWTWFPSCLCTEDNFGSGDISMVFATWLIPDGGYGWRSNLAPPPPAEQLQRLLPYLRPAAIA